MSKKREIRTEGGLLMCEVGKGPNGEKLLIYKNKSRIETISYEQFKKQVDSF